MEAVRAFNNELSSLYEVKPPVSRAKMTHVTKCAIKAIKFYKHVVQSVEKFILKCKPEYKVPGLYVIDSIVRQSRHQFGQEKDVYAPRFTKNIVVTFQNLFKCPTDERSKIVRVLNLWQKNGVFPIEVIQPLMDLAGDPNNADLAAAAQRAVERVVPTPKSSQQKAHTPAKPVESAKVKANPVMNSQASADSILTTQTDMLNTVNQLLQQTQQPQSLDEQQQQLHQLQILQQQLLEQTQTMQHPEDQGAVIDNTLLAQIQTLTNQLLSKTGDLNKPPEPSFDKKLLDFDYGESDEDDDRKEEAGARNSSGPVQHLLTDPALMEHIQQMSQTIQKTEQLKNELNIQEQMRQQMLQQQQEEFDQQINQGPGIGRPPMHPGPSHPVMAPYPGMIEPPLPPDSSQDMETDDVIIIHDDTDFQRDRSHRGRDRSRSPKRRRRSRSRSRDRRKRSRSRDRRRRSRSGDREKAREKERERWKKRLPPIKEKHVSVCSTTIWVGHLAKLTSEEELVRELENYGAVDSINMIPPRGCAFVCMNRRKDAAKAVEKMKGLKINGSAIKIAWAPGKSMKDLGFKDMWNVDLGVTYVPWDKLPTDPSLLVDGGMIDEDTIPDHLKELAAAMHQTEAPTEEKPDAASVNNVPVPIGLPPGGPPSLPPGQPPFPQMPGLPPANSIRVLQPGQPVGLLNPMLIPMPGQTLANMPGAQVGMHPIMSLTQPRLPQVNAAGPIPLMSIPNQTSTTSAGSQLNAAIQNIMSSSGGPTAVTQAVPGMVRPGFSGPRPGMFQPGFNPPGFNPNVPPPHVPPPNFRLPPPAFGGSSAPLGDGDSTPEQDEGQATVTKVISNDWPSKFPNREGDDRDQFPKTPGFGQPPSDIRMPLPHEQNLLPSSQAGNRLPPPRGPAPPVFSQHNSPMNANSPRPLLGPRMMQPERPDMNGPSVRPFMVGPQGIAGMNRPFGPGAMGNQMRPQGPGDMGGPQPLMGNRFGGPRNPGQSLLGIRPGFPGSRMLGPPQQRFGSNPPGGPGGPGGPRPQSFGHPMDDRIRPLFGDSPNRPFERPDFDRFGDRPRFHHPRGNGPDDRPLVPDRWGPLDGPPGLDRERDPGDRGGPFRDRFERNEFRRDDDGNPDWRVNRRESRNHRMPFEDNEMASPGRRRDSRGRHGDRDEQDKGGDRDRDRERDRDRGRDRDRDRSRRSRWSNLDPSQTGEAKENFSEPAEHMDDSVNMETVDMNISANSGEHDEEKTKGSVLQSAGVESDLMAQSQTSESIDKSQVDVVKEPEVGAGTVEALPEVLKELPEAQSNTDRSTGQLNEAAMPVSEILATVPSEPAVVPSESIDSVPAAVTAESQHTAQPVETEQQREVDQSQVTPANGSSTHAKEEPVVQKQPNDIVLNESTAEKPCPAKTQSPMEEGELEPGEVSS